MMRPTDVVSVFAPPLLATGIEWMVAGGVAAIVYGEPRFTQDLDVVVALKPAQAGVFAQQFPDSEFYCAPSEVIAEEAEREAFGHFNVLHLNSDARADIYLAGQDPLARRGLDTKRSVTLAGLSIPLAAPEYVILHKLRFRKMGASERHLRDIRAMLRVLGNDVDTTLLQSDAASMGLAAQWIEMTQLAE
ncbi:MAG: hypothetical protein M3Y64_00990 [Gemmatimonadota bacterium]|nr:hypothetical protein [Gemmatimonadota bacterium]